MLAQAGIQRDVGTRPRPSPGWRKKP